MKIKKISISALVILCLAGILSCGNDFNENLPELNIDDQIDGVKGVGSGGITPVASTPDPLPGEYAFQHFFNLANLDLENPVVNAPSFNFVWNNIKWLGGTANQYIEGSGGRTQPNEGQPYFERIPYATWRSPQINFYDYSARQVITAADVLEHGPIEHKVLFYHHYGNSSLNLVFELTNIIEFNDLNFNDINYPDGITVSVIGFRYDEVELGEPFIGGAQTYFVEERVQAVNDPIGKPSNMNSFAIPGIALPQSTYIGLDNTSGSSNPNPPCGGLRSPCLEGDF